MAFDDPKLPRAVLQGDSLFVGDDKEPYVRDPDYVLRLDVGDLRIAGGFEPTDPMDGRSAKAVSTPALRGVARLEGRDTFAGAGFDVGANPAITFHLRPVAPQETRHHWMAGVGYNMADWEFETEGGFWVQGYCPSGEYDRIVAAVRSGRVEHLQVAMTTTMWTKQRSNGFMPGMAMTFCIAPQVDQESTMPALERGFIQSITWDESYGAGRRPAPSSSPAAKTPPAAIELPARVYSLLTGIVVLLAGVVGLLLFRK